MGDKNTLQIFETIDTEAVVVRRPTGMLVQGDSRDVLRKLPDQCCDLFFFSPPFTMEGINDTDEYIAWLWSFFELFDRLLKPEGSIVFELGQKWQEPVQARSTHGFRFVADLFARGPWQLLQEFYWYNPSLLVTPAPWLQRRERFRDSVTIMYWLARSTQVRPHLDRVWGRQVSSLTSPYDNLLCINDGPEDLVYLNRCQAVGTQEFCDRFPLGLPRFFVELLTDPQDLVIDPFAGSGTTGAAADACGRRWLCVEQAPAALHAARLRFEAN